MNFYLFIHHFAWFVSVFISVALIARYLIGIPRKKLHYILYASPIILLPMVHAWVVGGKLHLQYLRSDISNILFHMTTFNIFHPQNFIQSSVLISTFIIFFITSLFYEKKFVKSFLIAIFGYAFLYLFMGVQWFGVAPNTKAIFAITTSLSNHQLLAVIYSVIMIIGAILLFLPAREKVGMRFFKS